MSIIITNVDVGHGGTPEEAANRDAYIAAQVTAGTTNGQRAAVPNATSGIRAWTTMDAANAFIAFCNTNYNPAPVLAVVQTV